MPIFIKIIFSIIFLIGIINPKITWKMSEGWKFKDAEPNTAYFVITRIVSIIALLTVLFIFPNQV